MPRDKEKKKISDKRWAEKNKERSKKRLYEKWQKFPWLRTLSSIKHRCCYNKSHHYYKNGVKNYLTIDDIKFLWFRDSAYNLQKSSIDRIDPNGHYTIDNCRFIELTENNRGRKRNVRRHS